jgi:bacteriorhodopsin
MSILLVSGVSWVTIIFSVAMSGFWVVAWISASLVTTVYRWGFFVFGVVAFFVLAYQIGFAGMKQARGFSTDRYYLPIAYGAIFIWLVYPIAWGLDEGGNKITVTSGLIFYSILDIIQIPVFGTFFIYYSRCWDLKALGLDYTQHGRVHGDRVNGGDHEKSAQASGAAEGTNNAGTA